jgi:hypothetical protein
MIIISRFSDRCQLFGAKSRSDQHKTGMELWDLWDVRGILLDQPESLAIRAVQ